MQRPSFFRRYLLPGFVFQSVVIAGGYGTGRELAEFFLTQGPLGGLLGMAVSTLVWSAVCMATFEFARLYRTYDYRHFFKALLGPGWVLFEICYVALLVIVLAVIAAAAGTILHETFDLAYAVGVVGIIAAVGVLVFGGSAIIERFLAGWSFLLYAVYVLFFIWAFRVFGSDISAHLQTAPPGTGWAWAGLRYAGYNLAVIPAVLITLRHHECRVDTLVAGALAGPIAIVPGVLFYLAMVGLYPDILERPVPANMLLETLGSRTFQITFQVVLFGTLIETGTGLIHAVNERIAGLRRDHHAPFPRWVRPAVATAFLVLGALVSRFGLIGLIARGYGTLTFLFIAIYVLPVLTLGVLRIRRAPVAGMETPAQAARPEEAGA
ncbi:MAG: hypothetical protein ACE5GJ_07350 [Gemmatimonadota bacterium]